MPPSFSKIVWNPFWFFTFINMPSFNVVVVGAGIAGLTTALALTHKGHKVTVLEKYVETNAMGGPIQLAPNATRVLFE